jgi:hypothetical protein
MSFMTGGLAGGGSAFCGARVLAAFSAPGGFASSSEMMRRIDARISSIEGSWTFAGCVMPDSTSLTPSYAFYISQDRMCRFPMCGLRFSSHKPDLSPDQAPIDTSRTVLPLPEASERSCMRRESLCCLQ